VSARDLEQLREDVQRLEDERDRNDMLGRIDELQQREKTHGERRRGLLMRYRATLEAFQRLVEERG
jgi:hypothetical protein